MEAILQDCHQAVRSLLHHGADVEMLAAQGLTALMVATIINAYDIVRPLPFVLSGFGVQPPTPNPQPPTPNPQPPTQKPQAISSTWSLTGTQVRVLVDAGANLDVRTPKP
jgi:hypothetical protein